MPNLGRCAECPFYVTDRNKSITCEDACRRYSSLEAKKKYMDRFCYSQNWLSCTYAIRLNELYQSLEELKPQDRELEILRHMCQSLKAENAKLMSMLGHLEKKNKKKKDSMV